MTAVFVPDKAPVIVFSLFANGLAVAEAELVAEADEVLEAGVVPPCPSSPISSAGALGFVGGAYPLPP